MADGSIINFNGIGKLAKPAEKLIDRVASGIGLLYEPRHIREKAKAETDARMTEAKGMVAVDRLLAQAEIKNQELGRRALTRLVQEEAKSQQNMEDVLEGATHYLNEDSKPEGIEDDWLRHLFSKCRMVSDKEMKNIWSKILAGEANRPGSFSKRTVEFVSTLSKSEAEAFARLCRCVWVIGGTVVPLVTDLNADIYKKNGIHFGLLAAMDSLGLIRYAPVTGYMLDKPEDVILASYCGETFRLSILENPKRQFSVGHAIFSLMGIELLRIIEVPALDGMVAHALELWSKGRYSPASPWVSQTDKPIDGAKE